MFGPGYFSTPDLLCRRMLAASAALILLPLAAAAQERQAPTLNLSGPARAGLQSDVRTGVRRITLTDAQQLAQTASDPLKRLGELQVEAARQHRLGVRSLYFPSVATQFLNLHLSAEPGQLLTFQRPLIGSLISIPVQVVFQDQTLVNVVATQPITQLLAVHQLAKIARADENIARAKAGMPVEAVTRKVEKNFFDLLVAQRELAAATADARQMRTRRVTVTVGDSGALGSPAQAEALRAETSTALLAGNVATLAASLNGLLGLAADTSLELVPPAPLFEKLTLADALAQAQTAPPPEVIEAEQTAAKAHAAAKIAKLDYVPGVAVIGGYLHQDVLATSVLPESFGYVGVVATWTIFDGLKREHAVKEAAANEEAADLGVRLAKEKAAAAVKSAYFQLERARDAYYLARRVLSTGEGVRVVSNRSDAESRRAQAEADLFRADIAYREAYSTLTNLIAGK